MSLRSSSCSALALAAALATAGCAVGPDFSKPQAPGDAGYTTAPLPEATASANVLGGDAQRFLSDQDVPFKWWEAFGSPALNSLVEEAFRANPTIPAAQAALRQAQEGVYAQQGYFFPTVGASYNFERQKVAGNLASSVAPGVQGNGSAIEAVQTTTGPGRHNQPLFYNFHTAQLTVSYTPDVFGLNRRTVESLEAQAAVQRYELEATYVSLAANVVAAAVQEASTRAQIAATKEIIEYNRKSLLILQDKFKDGYAMRLDVALVEAQLAQAEALLPPLEATLEQTRDLLRVLVGRLPNRELDQTFTLASLTLPREVPLSLPSKIIEERPDVRAAEEQLRSANAQVGIAIANRLPGFNISGSLGGTATVFDQMFAPGGPFWTLIGSVSAPVFDGGTLLHRERAADQALYEAAAQYRGAVLTAYQNIADTLHAMVSDARELAAADRAERAARLAADVTQDQLKNGYTDYLALYAAEIAFQQAELALVQAQATRFGDTVALYQALGGGWWNRDSTDDIKEHQDLLDLVSGP